MSWEQGYEAGNAGLIAAVNTAKMLGRIEEHNRVMAILDIVQKYNETEMPYIQIDPQSLARLKLAIGGIK